MTGRIPSMSKTGLLLSPCLYWALPEATAYDETKIPRGDTELRDNGTILHRWIAGESDPELDVTTDQTKYMAMYQHAKTWLDEQCSEEWQSLAFEQVYGVNWETGAVVHLPEVKNREYPYEDYPGYQFGTADVVMTAGNGVLWVGDWKSGEGLDAGAKDQLLSLLYAAHVAHGHPNLSTVCLKLTESGVFPDWKTYTIDDLVNHRNRMRERLRAIASPETVNSEVFVPRMGLHCTAQYCPHLGHCDAVKEAIMTQSEADNEGGNSPEGSLLPAESLLRKVTDTPASDNEAGYTMAVVAAARRRLKYIEQGVKDYLAAGGRAVVDNYEWSSGNNGYRWRKERTNEPG